jgi:hypothetical protein
MRNEAVSQESAEGMETGMESDEAIVYTSHHRELIVLAGKCAQAEQRRLEQQLGLQDGRTPRQG